MSDKLQKAVDDYAKELDKKLKRKKITYREWGKHMAYYECLLNGGSLRYPWLT